QRRWSVPTSRSAAAARSTAARSGRERRRVDREVDRYAHALGLTRDDLELDAPGRAGAAMPLQIDAQREGEIILLDRDRFRQRLVPRGRRRKRRDRNPIGAAEFGAANGAETGGHPLRGRRQIEDDVIDHTLAIG